LPSTLRQRPRIRGLFAYWFYNFMRGERKFGETPDHWGTFSPPAVLAVRLFKVIAPGRKKSICGTSLILSVVGNSRLRNKKWEVEFVRWIVWAVSAWLKPKASLMAENLCLRQQLLVLQRRSPRLRLRNPDRQFWILACRWFPRWRKSLLIVKPETVLAWHRKGWKAYWRWRSRPRGSLGRRKIPHEVKDAHSPHGN
jgi:hypothetical protein